MASENRESKMTMHRNKKNFTTELHGGSTELHGVKEKRIFSILLPLFFLRATPWLSLVIILLTLSCQSTPKTADSFLEDTNSFPLAHGASLYIFADAKEARPIIDLLPIVELNDPQTKQMLDRTDFFAAALFPKESGRRFQLAAWGNYPSSQADFAFTFSKDWSKNRSQSGGSYWYSSASRLSLSIASKQAFAASSLTTEPFDPFTTTAGVEMPEGFAEFRAGSPFSCWLEDPAPMIRRILNDSGIPVNFPVQQLFINLFQVEKDQYEAVIKLRFENQTYARGVSAIFSLAANYAGGNSRSITALVFLANQPALNGDYVDLRSAVLNKEEITRLLNLFLVN